eukprot:6214144-Pleurochrysis_carterae.AAC.2
MSEWCAHDALPANVSAQLCAVRPQHLCYGGRRLITRSHRRWWPRWPRDRLASAGCRHKQQPVTALLHARTLPDADTHA